MGDDGLSSRGKSERRGIFTLEHLPRASFVIGFLMLLGAGCVSKQMTEIDRTSRATDPIVIDAQDGSTNDVLSTASVSCYRFIDDKVELQRILDVTLRGASQLEQSHIDALEKEMNQGWRFINVCMYPERARDSNSTAVFVLQKSKEVTEQELKDAKTVINFKTGSAPSLEDFDGTAFMSLVKFVYIGSTLQEEDPFASAIIFSPLFIVNGGPNQVGDIEDLAWLSNPQLGHKILYAATSGGNIDSYYAGIMFDPLSNPSKLDVAVCDHVHDTEKDLGNNDVKIICHK